jgi:hypothetical protein
MFSFGLFPGVCSLNANVSEHCVCSIFIGESVWSVTAVEKVGYSGWKGLARKIAWAPGAGYFSSQTFSLSQRQSHFVPTRLWRCNRQSVPKRWHLNYRRRGTTQKKTYDIQNTAKVWNQEKQSVSCTIGNKFLSIVLKYSKLQRTENFSTNYKASHRRIWSLVTQKDVAEQNTISNVFFPHSIKNCKVTDEAML